MIKRTSFLLFIVATLVCGNCGNDAGEPGHDGANGVSCSVTSSEAGAVVNCSDGTVATILNGAQGSQGPQGEEGARGPAGSSVTTVKLCADDTSSFPEYAVKIGTILYAVYWDRHQAFLALLNPGSYISTNGTECTFTVNADGTVSR